MVPSHSDIEKLLSSRLEEVRKEKSLLKDKIEQWDSRLREAKRLAGNPPKESEGDIQQLIFQLERQYATTSQSKAEERKFLFEIDKLKQKKKSAVNYNKYSSEIEILRSQLSTARSELLEKETAIDELSSGLRKVKLAARAGCNGSELIESIFDVDASKLPQIVGKGGMNVRSLEGDFGVSIDIDHVKGSVRITGTPNAIQNAYQAMVVIMDTVAEEFSAKYETICCLMMEKMVLLNEIQSKYDVRIDVNQSKGICKIIGLTLQVEQAKKDILTIPSSRLEMKVEKSFFPLIIGKGGSNLRSIESENRVMININREDDVIELVGFKVDVQNASKKIKDIVEENREVEELLVLEKHVLLGCFFVGPSSSNVRSIGKEFNVRIETEGGKEERQQTIRIKGINSKVQPAKAHMLSLIQNYKNDSNTLEIADEVIPALLGKQGAAIKDMRAKYPDANIDIDGSIIHIHSASPLIRRQVLDEIHLIIGENYMESLDVSEDFAVMLKSQKASELRDRFTNELNIKMNIDKSNKLVKLKGSQLNVKKGMDELTRLQSNYVTQTVAVPEEDYPILLQSGDESLVRSLCDNYKVDISANRKDLTFTIRGQPGQVQAVVDYINGLLNGDEIFGSQMLKLDTVVSPSFIGKAGANVKKLETELGVKFDLLKSRGLLRIRGDREKVARAKAVVSKFLLGARVNDGLILDEPFPKEKLNEISKKLSDIYGAEIDVKDNEVTVRSSFQVLYEAKQYVSELVTGRGSFSLPLLDKHITSLKAMPDYGLGKFKGKFTIEICKNSIQISGDTARMIPAKRDFMRAVHGLFPTETAFIEISRACIRDIVNAELLLTMERLGAAIQCDRSLGFLWLVCPDHHLHSSQLAVEAKLSPWKALNASIKIDEFMIPLILGKNGTAINSLRSELDCSIEIDRTALTLDIKCNTTEALKHAISSLQTRVNVMRSEHWETKIRPEFVPLLIGKKGANINQFRAETGVQIDIDPKSSIVTLTGPEGNLAEARRRLNAFIEHEEKYRTLPRSFHLPVAAFPVLLGLKGATVKDLQEKSGAKVELDRETKKCLLRGRNEDCERAFELINDILAVSGFKPISRLEDKVEMADDEIKAEDLKDHSGDNDVSKASISRSQLSKSALKRLRKKERLFNQSSPGAVEEEMDDDSKVDDEDDQSAPFEETKIMTSKLEESSDSPAVILPPFSILPETDPIVDGLQFQGNGGAGVIGQSSGIPQAAPQDLVNFLLGKEVGSRAHNAPSISSPSTSRLSFASGFYPTAPSIHDVMFSAPVFGAKAANIPPPGLAPATTTSAKPTSFSFSTSHAPSIANYKQMDPRSQREASQSIGFQNGGAR